jgi:parallel beta-helix repeat protein
LVIYGANNTLKNNAIAGSKYNFRAEGIQDIDTSNTVNGKPIRYLVHEKDLIIDSSFDVGYLGIVNSRNITVRDLILTNNLEGILLDHSSDSKIENVTILNCETGIYLKSTSNNAVTNNNASNNYITGIYLQNASDNFISNNNVSNNSIGIYLWDCSNNNILTYNTVNFNSFYGIGFFNALNNNIYLNNFNNSWNVRPSGQTNTSWNSTSKINYQYSDTDYSNYLGNYWSDYNGSDNDNDGIGDTSYSIDSHHDYRPLMQPWENYFAPPENQLPIAQFTCVPPNPAVNETVSFNASESYDLDGFISLCEFEFGDGTNGTGEVLAHAYSSVGEYTVNLTVTDNEGATNRTSQVIRVFPDVPYFDTEPGTYPSICGTHNGTIEMTHTVNVSEIFIYSCVGTGGHIKYAKIWNASWGGTEAHWSGYTGDWHTCSFDKNFTLVAGETYNYTIYTGSYSQVHHKPELLTAKGWITCTEFTDVNGKRYCTWIPAIRLE